MKKHFTIWSNEYDEIESIVRDLKSEDEYASLSNEELYDRAYDLINDYLVDERYNLSIPTGKIIAIADIGRWNGRVKGYKEIQADRSGRNLLSNILFSEADIVTWYCDQYNLRATEHHHDGTNYILYREKRPGVSDTMWDNFLDKLYYGRATDRDIRRYTKSLKNTVMNIY